MPEPPKPSPKKPLRGARRGTGNGDVGLQEHADVEGAGGSSLFDQTPSHESVRGSSQGVGDETWVAELNDGRRPLRAVVTGCHLVCSVFLLKYTKAPPIAATTHE